MIARASASALPRNVPPPPNPDSREIAELRRHHRVGLRVPDPRSRSAVITRDEVLSGAAQAGRVQGGGELEQGLFRGAEVRGVEHR